MYLSDDWCKGFLAGMFYTMAMLTLLMLVIIL